MSIVEDVEARILMLQQKMDIKQRELHDISLVHRYNPEKGVDEDRQTLRSTATCHIHVLAARNILVQNGFLSGNQLYVRLYLEPMDNTPRANLAWRSTKKRPIQAAPCWQERMTFDTVPLVQTYLNVQVYQEERLGADVVLGAVRLDLATFADQRTHERWYTLSNPTNSSSNEVPSEILLNIQFLRSRISRLELEVQLTASQLQELRTYAQQELPMQVPMRQQKKRERVITTKSPNGIITAEKMDIDLIAQKPFKRQKTSTTGSSGWSAVVEWGEKLVDWLLPQSKPTFPPKSQSPTGSIVGGNGFAIGVHQTKQGYSRGMSKRHRPPHSAPSRPVIKTERPATYQSKEYWIFKDPRSPL